MHTSAPAPAKISRVSRSAIVVQSCTTQKQADNIAKKGCDTIGCFTYQVLYECLCGSGGHGRGCDLGSFSSRISTKTQVVHRLCQLHRRQFDAARSGASSVSQRSRNDRYTLHRG